jgi:hypothetical protein
MVSLCLDPLHSAQGGSVHLKPWLRTSVATMQRGDIVENMNWEAIGLVAAWPGLVLEAVSLVAIYQLKSS